MKRVLLLAMLLLATGVNAQIFHFNSTMTTLVKTTAQSPAHWYLEIFNDAGMDTTLRWKATFSNIPPQWNVNFDDQDNYYTNVNDGDSADFTLFDGLAFPQKLIIGAEFNGVPGSGSIYFDIYDPANPSFVVTIEYRYIVSAADLDEINPEDLIIKQGSYLLFDQVLTGGTVELFDITGSKLATYEISGQLSIEEFMGSGIVFVLVRKEHQVIVKKELLLE